MPLILDKVKQVVRKPVYGFLSHPAVRKWRTDNFSSPRVALGERNRYLRKGDWITVDLAEADFNIDLRARIPLPFDDDSREVVYSAHTFEHLDNETVAFLMKECRRILKPGGGFRVEVPDLEKFVHAYRTHDRHFLGYFQDSHRRELVEQRGFPVKYAEEQVAFIGEVSNYIVDQKHIPVYATREEVDARLASLGLSEFGDWCVSLQTEEQRRSGGHINPFFRDKMETMLREAGFREVFFSKCGETRIPGLNLDEVERPHRAFFSLYAEAIK